MVGEMPTNKRTRMTLLKVKGGGQTDGVIAGEVLATLRLHWIGNRSYVCPGGECEACREVGSRWAGFLPVLVELASSGRSVVLLEVTEVTWGRFDGLCRMEGEASMFGVRVAISRRSAKQPLVVDPLGRESMGTRKPIPVRLVYDVLATLYQLPSLADGESVDAWSDRAAVSAAHQLQVALLREARG